MMNVSVKSQASSAKRTLAGKVALITGSTSSIGLGIAQALAAAGADIVLNGLGVAAEIGRTREQIAAEFGVKASFSPMIAATLAESGWLDTLVNNAGIQKIAPLDQFPVEKWDQIFAISLTSILHTTRLALPAMRQNSFGRIASAHALVASPFKSAYVAAKHGIVRLTKVTALETAEEYLPGLRLHAASRGADRRPCQGIRHFARPSDLRRAAGATAEQALCNGGRTRCAHCVSVDRGCGFDCRYCVAGPRRLDRALKWPA
jgi:NAD(P)-dependent dehydrogenase (short-subunit alcohol dehydrogenase family)